MDSLRKIAAHLDLSHATVSAALRGLPGVKPSTRERVLCAVARTGYRLNPLASALMGSMRRPQGSVFRGVLAVLHFAARQDDAAGAVARGRIVAGASARAAQLGFILQEIAVGTRGFESEKLHDVLFARGVQGLLLVGLASDKPLNDFKPVRFPCVCAGTSHPGMNSVLPDTQEAMAQALRRLHAGGYRSPALILRRGALGKRAREWETCFLVASRQIETGRSGGYLPAPLFLANDPDTLLPRLQAGDCDCIITDLEPSSSWTEVITALTGGLRAIVRLDLPPGPSPHAGLDLRLDLVGQKSVAILTEQIFRKEAPSNSETFTTLCPPLWRDGEDATVIPS